VTTSARKADMTRDREQFGFNDLDSPERRSWQQALQTAKETIPIDDAMRLVDEVNASPRPLNDVETAGLVVYGADLKNRHSRLMNEIAELDDPAELMDAAAKAERVENEFDALSRAVRTSGTEKGRALAAQKLTIDQDFKLVSVLNRAKAAKGAQLSPRQRTKGETLIKAHDTKEAALQQKVVELQEALADKVLQSSKRHRAMSKAEKKADLDSLYVRARQLLDAGCHYN
jgi:hypothetical protein